MSELGKYLLQTLVTLLLVGGLSVFVLVLAKRAGVGRPLGPMRLLGRLPLDGRRVVYLVRAGKSAFVLGASEAGLTKLGEMPADDVEISEMAPEKPAFRELLERTLARKE